MQEILGHQIGGSVHIPKVGLLELKMNLKLIRVNRMWQMNLEANRVLHQF